MCTFYCPVRKNRSTVLAEGANIHIQQHIHHKDLNFCLPLSYYGKFIVKLEKNTNKDSSVFIVLIIWPNFTLKLLFAFGFNEFLWPTFSFLCFENFRFCISVVVTCLLIFGTDDFKSPQLHCWLWIIKLRVKITKCVRLCQERSAKEKSNPNVVNPKLISWSIFSIYIVETFLKIVWWQFLVSCSESLVLLAVPGYSLVNKELQHTYCSISHELKLTRQWNLVS